MYQGTSTSLILIAVGAILAFAINATVSGINVHAIGVILMIVGLIGMLMSLIVFGEWASYPRRRRYYRPPPDYLDEDDVVPPHEHRRVDTKDVVYEDDRSGPRVERERRIERR